MNKKSISVNIILILCIIFEAHGGSDLVPHINMNPPKEECKIPASPQHKYSQCIEDMPLAFQNVTCAEGKKSGKDCLDNWDETFIADLKRKGGPDWDRWSEGMRFNDNGDSRDCLRWNNGVLKRYSEAFLDRTKTLAEFIKKTADYYGIPPEAIACSIGGDATATASVYPDQSKYENNMIQSMPVNEAKGDLNKLGLYFSTPPAGSNGATPQEIESIRNAALILRHAKEAFSKVTLSDGTELRLNSTELPPEVLTSIYHLGVYRNKSGVRSKSSLDRSINNPKPGLSFLGLTCQRFKSTLRYKLGL